MCCRIDHPNVVKFVDFFFYAPTAAVVGASSSSSASASSSTTSAASAVPPPANSAGEGGRRRRRARDRKAVFYVMELADGELSRELRRNPHIYDRVDLARDLCRGVAFLHRSGIYHGDIKPPNLLIFDRTLRVGDLGMATYSESSDPERCPSFTYASPETLVRHSSFSPHADAIARAMGWPESRGGGKPGPDPAASGIPCEASTSGRSAVTPEVSSLSAPSVAEGLLDPSTSASHHPRGENVPPDPRARGAPPTWRRATDIWSLGACLAFIMSGRNPFRWDGRPDEEIGAGVMSLIGQLAAFSAPEGTLRELGVVDRNWRALIARMMDPDPGRRPATVDLLLEDPLLAPPGQRRSSPAHVVYRRVAADGSSGIRAGCCAWRRGCRGKRGAVPPG